RVGQVSTKCFERVDQGLRVRPHLLTKIQRRRIRRQGLKAVEEVRNVVEKPGRVGIGELDFECSQRSIQQIGSGLTGTLLKQAPFDQFVAQRFDTDDVDST